MNTHLELEAFKSNLFSVPLTDESLVMIENVGRWVICKNPTCPNERFPHKIAHLQKDYQGNVCYRGSNQLNTFGMVIDSKRTTFITEEQAKEIHEALVTAIWYTDEYVKTYNVSPVVVAAAIIFNPHFDEE